MGNLTHQQKCAVASLNVQGHTIDEIVAMVGADREAVEEFVTSRDSKRARAEELRAKGVNVKDIAEELSVSQQTVYNWTNKVKPKMEIEVVSEPVVYQTVYKEIVPAPETEKEPAHAEAETSPKEKYLQEYNTSVSGVCQVEAIANLFYHAERACKSMMDTYDNMTGEEQRAFDMGETYRDMLSVRNDLEKLMKAGEQA